MINDITERELSSSGGKPFIVLVENDIAMVGGKMVYVRIVVVNNKPLVKFGYFVKGEGRKTDFVELEGFDSKIERFLESTVVGNIDFSPVIDLFSGINVEINYNLRLINYSRNIFKTLANSIYKEGVTSTLSAGSMELTVEQVNRLYDFFENRFVSLYVKLLNGSVERYVKNFSNIVTKTHIMLRNFVVVMFTGKCIVNPFLDSYKMKRIFMQTDLYDKMQTGLFKLSEDSQVYIITNKEICEGLHLNKYLKFNKNVFTYVVLGLLNPQKYPNINGRIYIDEEGRPLAPGTETSTSRQVSTLYSICSQMLDKSIARNRLDEYVSVLGESRL